jgi:hypothetical protein
MGQIPQWNQLKPIQSERNLAHVPKKSLEGTTETKGEEPKESRRREMQKQGISGRDAGLVPAGRLDFRQNGNAWQYQMAAKVLGILGDHVGVVRTQMRDGFLRRSTGLLPQHVFFLYSDDLSGLHGCIKQMDSDVDEHSVACLACEDEGDWWQVLANRRMGSDCVRWFAEYGLEEQGQRDSLLCEELRERKDGQIP